MNRDRTKPIKPDWLRVRLGGGPAYRRVQSILAAGHLNTVCEAALCPNKGTCWEHGRATVLILGDRCTRRCGFCNVAARAPSAPDPAEPGRVADAVREMGLTDVVITSVTRDDLPDGGAAVWAETIRRVRSAAQGILLEVLVPDFGGSSEALDLVMAAGPDVLGHNLEMVPSLYAVARPEADYTRSLGVLRRGHNAGLLTKTGVMLGLGETPEEVMGVMRDARSVGCEVFFLGQYLQPSGRHLPVRRYVEPAEFAEYRRLGLAMGFGVVVSAPLVRSSFHSDEQNLYVRNRLAEDCIS